MFIWRDVYCYYSFFDFLSVSILNHLKVLLKEGNNSEKNPDLWPAVTPIKGKTLYNFI